MTVNPTILVHSGVPADDPAIAALIRERHPALTVLTASEEAEIVERLPGAEILFAWRFPMPLLRHATSLRWLQVMGAGIETLAGAPIPDGVWVTNVRGVFSGSMAEYAIGYTLAHLQEVRRVLAQQARHEWTQFTPLRLADLTVGVMGLGSIGGEIARAFAALGARVVGLNRSGAAVAHVERVYELDQIDAFLPECDVLVSVVPHTPETTGLLSGARLALLKPGCFYINVGRGNVVDIDALTDVLRGRRIAGAALDVFPIEPLPAGHPLWDLDNVFITPHISGVNRPNDVTDIFLVNLERYLAGEPLLNQVDVTRGY
ncbi:MAG TPA: D-2-hydroxyacid dehydrogenase [Thermomicrobiales bacterium]|nr:D-2-hydroxyacid dehydrogenase [Thermomicrobiales bacterium]